LHPVALEEEVAVNIIVAAVVATNFDTELFHDRLLVQVFRNPAESSVAKIAGVFTRAANIIDILTGLLVWTNHGIVAVDTSRNARPNAPALVAAFDETEAAWKSVIHCLTFALVENSWPSSITASHRPVVGVLSESICESISDKNRLQVDVALLVREDLGCKYGNVMASIRFTSDVEVLFSVFRELFEKQCQ